MTPMEVELFKDGAREPRPDHLRPRRRGARPARAAVLQRRLRPLPHRLRRAADGRRRALDLHPQHRGDGGGRGQLRPPGPGAAAALHGRQPAPPAARPDEQPGAMPEIAPSPGYGRSIDKAFYDRAMVLQAWGTYGTLWPVVHQQLGVRPDMGRRALEVTPQVPQGQSRVARLEHQARRRSGRRGRDALGRHLPHQRGADVSLSRFTIGHTLPRGATVARPARRSSGGPHAVTNRGLEVLVGAPTSGSTSS